MNSEEIRAKISQKTIDCRRLSQAGGLAYSGNMNWRGKQSRINQFKALEIELKTLGVQLTEAINKESQEKAAREENERRLAEKTVILFSSPIVSIEVETKEESKPCEENNGDSLLYGISLTD